MNVQAPIKGWSADAKRPWDERDRLSGDGIEGGKKVSGALRRICGQADGIGDGNHGAMDVWLELWHIWRYLLPGY